MKSKGCEAERIRANADREREVILAQAYRQAQQIKGEGDAKANQIYARAFGKNPEFARFYRILDAYRRNGFFGKPTDMIVLDGSDKFFGYMKSPKQN